MNQNDIVSLISNVGFPIVACGALFWLNIKTSELYNKTMNEMRATINKNTETIEKFLDHVRKEDDKDV